MIDINNIEKNKYCNDIRASDYANFLRSICKESVDLVLTDPPYTISKDTGFKSVKKGVARFAVSMDFGEWDHDLINLYNMTEELYRILKEGGTVIIWYDLWKLGLLKNALEYNKFRMIRNIIWLKTNPVPINMQSTYLSNSREFALVAVKGVNNIFKSKYDNGIYEYPIFHSDDRFHPTQKPVKLFSDLIIKHSNKGDLVMDPFMGSGTTAVAAISNSRNFIGCDIDQKYVNLALSRIHKPIQKNMLFE